VLGEIKESGSVELWELPDKYPAENPGLLDGLIRGWKGRGAGATWVVGLQELLALDELARTGAYDPRWTISLGGQALKRPCHVTLWPGMLVSDVLSGRLNSNDGVRKVVGGLMTGGNAPEGAWVEPPVRSVTAVPEHVHREFIAFTMPGFNKDSFSYGFASLLLPGKLLPVHGGMRGQHRYCISCSYCEWVCPADINPQVLWKLVDVKEMEEASAMGLMRCIACGLCSYVCPCKLEMVGDLTGGIEEYRKILEEEAALKAKMG
jgi:Na+-transporting NADH:ubiquinone oxidoreductase subunit A